MSDEDLAKRRAQLQDTIEQATRDLIATLEKSVAIGSMTADQAADEFAKFTSQLKQIKGPSE